MWEKFVRYLWLEMHKLISVSCNGMKLCNTNVVTFLFMLLKCTMNPDSNNLLETITYLETMTRLNEECSYAICDLRCINCFHYHVIVWNCAKPTLLMVSAMLMKYTINSDCNKHW